MRPGEREAWPGVYEGWVLRPSHQGFWVEHGKREARTQWNDVLRQCRYWTWKGHKIRYQRSGEISGESSGEALVLVHGFGGNA